MTDITRIARAPHPSGSPEHAALRGYLMNRLGAFGMTVRTQQALFPADVRDQLNRRSGENRAEIPLVNIVAVLPGKDRDLPAVALMAHYDSVWGSPAAADDGAGVASILETVRALAQDRERRRDVMVILTDGEEANLNGARLFFGQAPEARQIGAIINLETRGGGGKANLFQTSAMNGDVARLWASSVPHPAGTSLATFIYSVLPNDTDLTVALPHGYPAWNFAFIGRPAFYHSPLATAANLDQGSLQQMGEQALELARAMANAPELPGKSPDIVFFDVFGLFAVHYAAWWGWVMLAVGFAGYAVHALRRFEGRAFVGGLGRMLGLVIVTGAALYLLNLLSGADGPVNYYDRLAAIPRLQIMTFCTSLAAALLVAGRKPDRPAGEAGLVLPLWLAGAAFQIFAPTAAYVLTIPLLLGGVVALLRAFEFGSVVRTAEMIVAGVVTGYMLMLGYLLMQAVGPTMPMVAVLPLAVTVCALVPLRGPVSLRGSQVLTVLLLLAAVGVALWVRLDAPALSIAVYAPR
ncbi:peptidase M28-like protein [Novosphingobium sp. PhB165]|uniref:M28 family peptidase n=1 Tax=Novosphingobium sp. PhB165 TaxID=2485105 RepID=UPI0010E83C26|nr:M28 family peptidase [Novosphingobium sp. PhB165]TCM21981.1 peptidase M28-like protein [Novosphingobium sp. PhB165]